MERITNRKSKTNTNILKKIFFHISGISCLIWFIIRVVPAPHRAHYPCQNISRSIGVAYLAFLGTIFYGFTISLQRTKSRISRYMGTSSVFFVTFILIASAVISMGYIIDKDRTDEWNPVPKDPIGTPLGIKPGRVVWVWNPNAIQQELTGYWWETSNTNQMIIDKMFSQGIKNLTGETNLYSAWQSLFQYHNFRHEKGSRGYQPGEKIAIKINMNNCYRPPYIPQEFYGHVDNEIDANPYAVKALLRQLVDILGVQQNDITVYDASRPIPDWFYYRVIYETYPTTTPVPEFLDVKFADKFGMAPGRLQVQESSEKIYFSSKNEVSRTLPTCVTEADYLINMPILKKHPIGGVTLSGKNLFGTWIECIDVLHSYLKSGNIMGNPAPQTDLLSHEHIGGKTILYVGDGLFGTKVNHIDIEQYHMYPFNDDWTNSLFFSQDPVALDSVMFDFLLNECSDICEGSQNYLHQSAEPPIDIYDPEGDGIFLNKSLGVHEHWNKSYDIFSQQRYSGPENKGIDFITIGEEYARPAISILIPRENCLYILGKEIIFFPFTFIIGNINVIAEITGSSTQIEKVEFLLDGILQHTDFEKPFIWSWEGPIMGKHTIKVTGFDLPGNIVSSQRKVIIFNI